MTEQRENVTPDECPDGRNSLSRPKICGSVYTQNNNVGLASYHFDSEEDCYILYSSPDCDAWPPLDNGQRPPLKKCFTNCLINEYERIFKGDIVWAPTSWNGEVCWSYEMHFSDDYESIISGQVVSYDGIDGNIIKTRVFGVDLKYSRLKEKDMSDICPVCLETVSEKCVTPCDHTFCKKCITQVLIASYDDLCPLCRTPIDRYNIKTLIGGELRTLFPSPKINGSVYIQGNTVGLASYHFDSEEDCYISYASPDCGMWPSLENGERPPSKKPFTNIVINENERIFKGDIVWAPTSWQGDVLWSYEMHFSEDYKTIIGGQVVCFDAMVNGNINDTHRFGMHLRYRRLFENDYLQ